MRMSLRAREERHLVEFFASQTQRLHQVSSKIKDSPFANPKKEGSNNVPRLSKYLHGQPGRLQMVDLEQ